jgi:hypothetical protein
MVHERRFYDCTTLIEFVSVLNYDRSFNNYAKGVGLVKIVFSSHPQTSSPCVQVFKTSDGVAILQMPQISKSSFRLIVECAKEELLSIVSLSTINNLVMCRSKSYFSFAS